MKKPTSFWLVVFGLLSLILSNACQNQQAIPPTPVPGAEQGELIKQTLHGKRAGLIVNQSSLVGDKHLIDVVLQEKLDIKKLFAVEHGIRGTQDAGAIIENSRDNKSGLPIISLYGQNKAPSQSDIQNLDILVFDLQDVGVRFFTYLSSLHYIMQSCAQYGVPLVVLDRPNPNISYIDGPILKPDFQSFVGMHPIPVLHGMTLGELALMINGESWLQSDAKCDLTIIPVRKYTRTTKYILPVKPSPNLPNQKAIELYPSLALFEATNISVGRGTEFPFQVLGGKNPKYGKFTFTPLPVPGAALHPKLNGQTLNGVDLRKEQISGFQIELFIQWYNKSKELDVEFLTRPQWLDKLLGTDDFRKRVKAGQSADVIRASWKDDIEKFKKRRAPYLLYKN